MVEPERVLIFNMKSDRELISLRARAFVRHAWGHMYRHFVRVEVDDKPFIPAVVFYHTLTSFRDAALRLAMALRFTTARVAHGKRPVRPPRPEHVIGIIDTARDATTGEVYISSPLALVPAFRHVLAEAESTRPIASAVQGAAAGAQGWSWR